MTTNQTIDGVPLLPCPFCGGEPYGTHDHYVHDDLSPMPCVECRSCSAHLKAEDWNRRVKPADQPQGVPVAMVRTHGSECWEEMTGESLEMCKAQPDEYEVRMLYGRPAEQPAPVSVVSDEQVVPVRRDWLEEWAMELVLAAQDGGTMSNQVEHLLQLHPKQ